MLACNTRNMATHRPQGSVSGPRRLSSGDEVFDIAVKVKVMVEGRPVWRTIRKRGVGRTRTEARAALNELLVKVQRGEAAPRRSEEPSAADRIAAYIAAKRDRGTVRPRSAQDQMLMLETHLRPALGNTKLSRLTPLRAQEIMDALHRPHPAFRSRRGILEPMQHPGLSPYGIHHAATLLSGACRYYKRMGVIPANPCVELQVPPIPKPRKGGIAPDEIAVVLGQLPRHWRAPVLLAAWTGLRRSELLGLRWRDLYLDGPTPHLRVERSLARLDGAFIYGPPKSSRSDRPVYLGPEAVALLRRQRDEQIERLNAEEPARVHRLAPDRDLPVFDNYAERDRTTRHLFEPMRPDSMSLAWRRARDRAGLARLKLKDLRDHAATVYLEVLDPANAAQQLGHSPDMTIGVYARPVDNRRVAAATLLENRVRA